MRAVGAFDRSTRTIAAAAAMYFIHATYLLRTRLALLNDLVDYKAWRLADTHPPVGYRVFEVLRKSAEFGEKFQPGMMQLDGDLRTMDLEFIAAADKLSDDVAGATAELLGKALRRKGGATQAEAEEFAALFNRSPVGVLHSLDSNRRGRSHLRSAYDGRLEPLLSQLPVSLRTFLTLSPRARVDYLLGVAS